MPLAAYMSARLSLSYICKHIFIFDSVSAILSPCVNVLPCPPPHSPPGSAPDTGNVIFTTPRQEEGEGEEGEQMSPRGRVGQMSTSAGDFSTVNSTNILSICEV